MTIYGKIENLNDITIFVEVAERRSFTRAAKSLRLSLPYVSRRVKLLEESLKTQLIIRSSRDLSLTEAGKFYYDRCAELLRELNVVHEEVGDLNRGLRGSIRLYSPLGFGEQVMPELVMKFNKLYPDITVELRIGDRSTNPREKGVDVAIRTADLVDSSLDSRVLGRLHYQLCASKGYLKAHGMPRTPRELAERNCLVHIGQPSHDIWEFDWEGQRIRVPVTGNLRSNSGAAILRACHSGSGIARLPEYDVREGVAAGDLKIVFPGALQFSRQLRAYYPRSNHMPARIDTFLEFLRQETSSYLAP